MGEDGRSAGGVGVLGGGDGDGLGGAVVGGGEAQLRSGGDGVAVGGREGEVRGAGLGDGDLDAVGGEGDGVGVGGAFCDGERARCEDDAVGGEGGRGHGVLAGGVGIGREHVGGAAYQTADLGGGGSLGHLGAVGARLVSLVPPGAGVADRVEGGPVGADPGHVESGRVGVVVCLEDGDGGRHLVVASSRSGVADRGRSVGAVVVFGSRDGDVWAVS